MPKLFRCEQGNQQQKIGKQFLIALQGLVGILKDLDIYIKNDLLQIKNYPTEAFYKQKIESRKF